MRKHLRDDFILADKLWKERDQKSWEFAAVAARIVGRYIPQATMLLAEQMGVRSPSTPEGYAKAHELAAKLSHYTKHKTHPLPNLFISHYVVMGKAHFSKDQRFPLETALELLLECSKFGKSVDWLRGKIGKTSSGDDSWINSVSRAIPMIEDHIINAPYLGVNSAKAAIAAVIGKGFVRVLRWAIQDDGMPEQQIEAEIRPDVDHMEEILVALIPETSEALLEDE